MSLWISLFILITISLIYRALINYSRFRKIKSLHYLYGQDHNQFIEESQIALSLFKEAGLEDSYVRVTTKSGLILRTALQDIPQYQQQTISVFSNLTFIHPDVNPHVIGLFMKSKGVFRNRLKESINPLFWIQYTLTLPTYLLEYLGVKEGKLVIKLVQVIYWVAGMIKLLHDLELIILPSI